MSTSSGEIEHLRRVRASDYKEMTDDPSYDSDKAESVLSTRSDVSCVELDEETKLRLLDDPKSILLRTQKPEKCHLLSERSYPELKSNPNNILFMSCFLHDSFDGFHQVDGVPDFALRYHSHNPIGRPFNINGTAIDMYEVTVRAVFRFEEDRVNLTKFFKNHTTVATADTHEAELVFYVHSADEFKDYLTCKYTKTQQMWRAIEGLL
jgi:hypothetical protein